MSMYSNPPPPAWLSDRPDPYLAAAQRWWWLLLLGCIIGAVAAVVTLYTTPASFQSTALVQVSLPSTSADQTANAGVARSAAINFAAEGTTGPVFERTAVQLAAAGIPVNADDLVERRELGQLRVTARRDTNLIAITVSDDDPRRAQRIADILAEAFITEINTRATTQVQQREQELLDQIGFTQRELVTAQLFQRQEALRGELAVQRSTLLQIQQSSSTQAANNATLGPQWQELLQRQARELERQLADTSAELEEVGVQLALRPVETDSYTSAALATAYAAQLNRLTDQYAQLQLTRKLATAPVVRYGNAARALQIPGSKLLPLVLVGGGVALGVFTTAVAEGLRLLKEHRKRRRGTPAAATTDREDDAIAPQAGLLAQKGATAAANGREIENLSALLGRLDALGVTSDHIKRPTAAAARSLVAED